jgi:hypothetical protein
VGKKIRTECSVEIDDVFVVKRLGRSIEGWCVVCARTTTLVTPEDAGTLVGGGARAIYRLVESGEIHWSEVVPENLLLVCLDSLLEKVGQIFPSE